MATYLIDHGFKRFRFGYGSAVAVILFVISFVVAMIYQRCVLRRDTEGPLAGRRADDDHHPAPASGPPRCLVYGVALAVVGVTLAPVVYVMIGGFRTTGQLAADPMGLPDPWVLAELRRRAHVRHVLAAGPATRR